MSERDVSAALLAFGIATLAGSRLGGFVTDRVGIPKSLVGSMAIQVIALVLISTTARSVFVTTL
ncbi:hypothetical protein [Alicyclobacillus herbarius]|uniref:hypothetical protein n=1 Tax=Alicyclobacillus herbarius TaxID=122960 RepID=UPI001FE1B75B|nr:hypothetical protein [Alicyclobacillus herbarius]